MMTSVTPVHLPIFTPFRFGACGKLGPAIYNLPINPFLTPLIFSLRVYEDPLHFFGKYGIIIEVYHKNGAVAC